MEGRDRSQHPIREVEKTYVKSREEEGKIVPNVWERVANQVDLVGGSGKSKAAEAKVTAGTNGSNGNKSAPTSAEPPAAKKDTLRFKAILLQLKNDPKAPGNQAVATAAR